MSSPRRRTLLLLALSGLALLAALAAESAMVIEAAEITDSAAPSGAPLMLDADSIAALGRQNDAWKLSPDDPEVKVEKSEDEWKRLLSREQYRVLRGAGTEPPGSCALLSVHRPGTFRCAACGLRIFRSGEKFDSGTGWPSFTGPIAPDRIATVRDLSHGMVRTEVRCARCGGHLGHVFDDGPPPTRQRYCMNGVAMAFEPQSAASAAGSR